MNKIKQIIRGSVQGRGTKKISKLTGVSRNTIKEYLKRFRRSGLTLEQVETMQDSALADIFIPNVEPVLDEERQEILQPLLPGIVKALRKKGITSGLLWEQYIQAHPNGYKLSQFRHYIRLYLQRKNVSMHFEHKAGDKVFIDYAGKHLYITDPETGEHIAVEVFVSVLGCSQYTYMEASISQKRDEFISSCQRMLEFYGGVPKAIVPDNLKSAVQKGSKYAPILNETFESFADHYNTTILPTRPRKPKDKSLVEGAVKLLYQRIYTKLEKEVFTSLNELNIAIWIALEEYNNKSLRGEESRKQLFNELEKSELLALPNLPYSLCETKICTVMKNCHVCLAEDKHYYSVPYRYMGKKVKMLYNETHLEVFYKYHKIATHSRDKRRHKYTTDAEHLSPNQNYVNSWSHEYFIAEGNKISEEVGQYLNRLMELKSHAEQGYKSCSGILHLAKKVGRERIILACRRAAEYDAYNYPIIEDILKRNLESLDPKQELIDEATTTPGHVNIRGKEYYS